MLAVKFSIAAFVTIVLGSDALLSRQSCGESYELCSPVGITTSKLPPVGPELSGLYGDLVQAVSLESSETFKSPSTINLIANRQTVNAFCCEQTSQCLLLPTFGVPFCWDRFTTDFYLPDGSYGSVIAGNYTSASGIQVNLIYGDWKSENGTTGNIYSDTPTMMPHTSTMPMPTLWTSSGVGLAVPGSQLGSSTAVNITNVAGPTTTITAITLPSSTITVGTSECTHCNITIIPGLTGLPPGTGTTPTNGNTLPSTITSNSTAGSGFPSSSGSTFTWTSIIPPFNSRAVSTFVLSGKFLGLLIIDITICAFLL